jgi:hypothetical protein
VPRQEAQQAQRFGDCQAKCLRWRRQRSPGHPDVIFVSAAETAFRATGMQQDQSANHDPNGQFIIVALTTQG